MNYHYYSSSSSPTTPPLSPDMSVDALLPVVTDELTINSGGGAVSPLINLETQHNGRSARIG